METTIGRIIFNNYLPEGLPYFNEAIGKKGLGKLVADCFDKLGKEPTSLLADNLKDIGFRFATKSGVTISQEDMVVPEVKDGIIDSSSEVVKQINDQYSKVYL